MACTSCKQKNSLSPEVKIKTKEQIDDTIRKFEKFVKWFVLIWSLFAAYGIYSFVKLFL